MARESQTPPARDTADSVPSMTSINTDDAGRLAQMRRALLEQQVRAAGSHPATRPGRGHLANRVRPAAPFGFAISAVVS